MEMKVDSPDPQNIPGELLVRGANVFLGYYKNEEATNEVLDADGWLHTGDMGIIDADGYLFLRGRSKCMILGPSGQNIYPEEIEAVLDTRPYVLESLVIEENGGLSSYLSRLRFRCQRWHESSRFHKVYGRFFARSQ